MFKAAGYKIRFERKKNLMPNRAGFDTRCQIYDEQGILINEQTARLHPKDKYDKLLGKKIALTKALAAWPRRYDKYIRTQIWIAFWQWVNSWRPGVLVNMKDWNNVKEKTD